MKPEQQRIAIAEALGWINKGPPGFADLNYKQWKGPDGREYDDCPDYPNDLDATNEAENVLFPSKAHQLNGPDKWAEYRIRLELKCVGHPGGAIRATATQRCECLVKTIGKWS